MSPFVILMTAQILSASPSEKIPDLSTIKSMLPSMTRSGIYIIAQKYGGTDPHGDDPHGDDPHDEQHDPKLPANADKTGKAPKDVYGGQVPNSKEPY